VTASTLAIDVWIAAFARSSAFSATVPLGGSGSVPRALRAVLALSLTPAVVPHISTLHGAGFTDTAFNGASFVGAAFAAEALIGAAFGLSAAVIAAAASSAGSFIDAMLASSAVTGNEGAFGNGGPVGRLYSLAFGAAFFNCGAMTHLCERFVTASSQASIAPTLHGAVELVRACCDASIGLAAPAIVAQVLGTIVAAASARAAPRVNGSMLSSPLVTALVLVSLLAAAPSTFAHVTALARLAATMPAL
jgi:flagellar biosynthesis protein FliR